MSNMEREKKSGELEAQACKLVQENRFLLGMKPAVKNLLREIAIFNNWQILKIEVEK